MQGIPRLFSREQASAAAAADKPDNRARNATWVPSGAVAGNSILAFRKISGAADLAFSAAASAVVRVAKAPTCIIQRPDSGPREKAAG